MLLLPLTGMCQQQTVSDTGSLSDLKLGAVMSFLSKEVSASAMYWRISIF